MSGILDDLTKGRRCMICGKLGGIGSTTILRMLGYEFPDRAIGYAHAACIRRARAKQRQALEKATLSTARP
jgi:hypothetical protein